MAADRLAMLALASANLRARYHCRTVAILVGPVEGVPHR